MVWIRPLIKDEKYWRCPNHSQQLFLVNPTGLRAHNVSLSSPAHSHIPSHVHILSTLGLVMVIQGPLAPLLSLPLAIVFVTAAYVFMVLSLSWLRNHSKLGVSDLCFVNARFPYLFCVTFLCVLRSCSVVVHICMRVWYIYCLPPSYHSS